MNRDDQLFTQLIYIFYSSAMMSMGKIKNPATDKIERNMAGAKDSIDILELIRTKTTNNLSEEQSRVLDQLLADLKLNYVDETSKDKVGS